MPQTPITTPEEFDAAKGGNGVFEKDAKTKMDTPPETFDPVNDKDKYFSDAAGDAAGDADTATVVDEASAPAPAPAADTGTPVVNKETPNELFVALEQVYLIESGQVPKKPLTPDILAAGLRQFCEKYKDKAAAPAAPAAEGEGAQGDQGGDPAAALGGGRRRSKRRQPKRSAKQSKKGGRSSKNRRKQSRRRKH